MRFLLAWIFMIGTIFTADGYASARNSAIEKPLVVIFMGPPAAGKGTQATTLSKTLSLPHISTGDLFRDNIRKETPVGKVAKSYIDQGKLVPDQVVLDMLFDRIGSDDCKSGYILDGFPRTVDQAKALDAHLGSNHEIVVINLNVDDAILIERITGRLVCKSCSRPFHKKNAPPKKENSCDSCGGALYQRDDDTVEVFAKRLEVYRNQTAPLIAYYGKKGELKEIDANVWSSLVFQEVMHAIPHLPALAGK